MECAIKHSLVIDCPDFEEEPGMQYPIPLKGLDLVEFLKRAYPTDGTIRRLVSERRGEG